MTKIQNRIISMGNKLPILQDCQMGEIRHNILYTIGHSNHTMGQFIDLLKRYEIGIVADVRSAPYSRYCPQFAKEVLSKALEAANIQYMFLGKELGARPDDAACYEGGCVNFKRLAERKEFKDGVQRVLASAGKYSVALMCAEKEPLDCHRTILICRNLKEYNLSINHILEDGKLEDHYDCERRLVKKLKIEPTLFEQEKTESDLIEQAYDQQSQNISYRSDISMDGEFDYLQDWNPAFVRRPSPDATHQTLPPSHPVTRLISSQG
jgi:hypothetical protein